MKGRVLVVDDDLALAEMLGIVLRNEGLETGHVADGSSAMDAFREQRPRRETAPNEEPAPRRTAPTRRRRRDETRPSPTPPLPARASPRTSAPPPPRARGSAAGWDPLARPRARPLGPRR